MDGIGGVMPFSEISVVDRREQMVHEFLSKGRGRTEVAERYGVSRPTLYFWVKRYREGGRGALEDRPPVAQTYPNATSPEIVAKLVKAKKDWGWGPKKLVAWLASEYPETSWPAPSTAGEILDRAGLVTKHGKRRRERVRPSFTPKYQAKESGDLFTTDFKGQFRTRDGHYCYPLTVMDQVSRYLLACRAMLQIDSDATWLVFEEIFREYGLPDASLSDNGVPFATPNSEIRLSRFMVQLMRYGVQPVLIDPGKPQQNGVHERMHRTLKDEVCLNARANLAAQQRAFNRFRRIYNESRPHEALGMQPPKKALRRPRREFPSKPPKVEYEARFEVRKVSSNGCLGFRGSTLFLSHALAGEHVALDRRDEQAWEVRFSSYVVGTLTI